MITAELTNYIKTQLTQAKTQAEIKATLLAQGWSETDINLALLQLENIPQNTVESSQYTTVITQTREEEHQNIFDFKNMKWYEWLAMLPAFLLLIQGGAIGAAIGVLGWSLSLKIIRNESRSKVAKILITIGITIAEYIVYFIANGLILGLMSS